MVAEVAERFLFLDDVKWSLAFGEYEGHLYFSLRTSDRRMNAGRLIREVIEEKGGSAGGHGSMAGASIPLRGLWLRPARTRFKQELVQRFLKEFGIRARKGKRDRADDRWSTSTTTRSPRCARRRRLPSPQPSRCSAIPRRCTPPDAPPATCSTRRAPPSRRRSGPPRPRSCSRRARRSRLPSPSAACSRPPRRRAASSSSPPSSTRACSPSRRSSVVPAPR